MALTVRRLGPGDERVLHHLAVDDADFDVDGHGSSGQPLTSIKAERYLANPAVLHWVANDDTTVVGFLYCIQLPLRSGEGCELLLYEIGVRLAWRRRGVGRALVGHMEQWMRDNGVAEVWVLADNPGAVEFYGACGFALEGSQPIYMTRRIESRET